MSFKSMTVCFTVAVFMSVSSMALGSTGHSQPGMSLNEANELRALENPMLLTQKAAGSNCETRCHNDPNSGERICNTSCSESGSGGYTGSTDPCESNTFGQIFMGCFGGALLGSLGGAAAAGCGVGAGLWVLGCNL